MMNIAILSRGPQLYSTQSLMRACLRRGHRVRILDHLQCHLVAGQGTPEIFYDGRPLGRFDAVIPRIGSSVTASGAMAVAHFEAMGTFTAIRSQALLQARDKWRCLQMLAGKGVAIPRTVLAGLEQPVTPLLGLVGGVPVVIKLLESTHGVGVILAETPANAESAVEAFHRLRERVIIQEFIREAGGADIRVLVVAGRVIATMKRQAPPGDFRSNLHRGATALPAVLTPEEESLVLRAAQAMDLEIAGVDLLRSVRGPLIIEVNASPGLEGIETVTGVDVAGLMVELVERKVWESRRSPVKE